MIIAIDGPAASGKGTLARRLAEHFGLPHLDTGLLFRATARALIEAGRELDDRDAAVSAARSIALIDFEDARLRGPEMGEAASRVAALPEVRAELMQIQRAFARRSGGGVLDGRDIGTVVCPEADVKIFVTASPQERARRRVLELRRRGEPADYEVTLDAVRRRDARDANRAIAPLRAAEDAEVLDTTLLDIDAAFSKALAIVRRKTGQRGRSAGGPTT